MGRGGHYAIVVARRAAAALRRITSTAGIRAFVQADASRNWTHRGGTPAVCIRGFNAPTLDESARDPSGIAR